MTNSYELSDVVSNDHQMEYQINYQIRLIRVDSEVEVRLDKSAFRLRRGFAKIENKALSVIN